MRSLVIGSALSVTFCAVFLALADILAVFSSPLASRMAAFLFGLSDTFSATRLEVSSVWRMMSLPIKWPKAPGTSSKTAT